MLKLGAGIAKVQRVLFGLLGYRSVAGLVLLGYDGIVYVLLLRRVPLTIVQSSAVAQFAGVIITATPVLGELISQALAGYSLYLLRDLRGRPQCTCEKRRTHAAATRAAQTALSCEMRSTIRVGSRLITALRSRYCSGQ
jgi:hypothetical protein